MTQNDALASNTAYVVNPTNGERIPADQLADCQSASPVVDLQGHASAAKKSAIHVYDAYCDILAGANPGTFVALDFYYGRDANGVWILDNPSEEGSLISVQIVGADPATFTLIPGPANEGFSDFYTKDKNHVYDLGQTVGVADPETFAIDIPPQVTTCQFDAHDDYLKFYRGQIVPQVNSEPLPSL